MAIITAIQHLGIAKETTWGTGVVPSKYVPFESVDREDVKENVVDSGRRSNITKDYEVIRTTKHAEVSIESNFYTNPVGLLFYSLLGSVTTTGVSPYTHVFKVGNSPPSLTVQHFDGSVERRFAGAVVDEISVKGDAEGLVTISTKLQSKIGADASTSVATYTTEKALIGANSALTINAAANTKLFGWEFTFKRENKLVFGAANSADPQQAVRGRVEVTGKLTFDVDNQVERDYYLNETDLTLALTLNGTASSSAIFTFTKAQVEKASYDDGDENLRVDLEFRAVYNTTDAGPCQVSITNTTVSY